MTKNEYKQWFESVDFIQDNMQFYSFNDFVKNCFFIKSMYKNMDRHAQKLYQWYVFSSFLNYNQKCIVWDFINDFAEYVELLETNNLFKNKEIQYDNIEQRNNDI